GSRRFKQHGGYAAKNIAPKSFGNQIKKTTCRLDRDLGPRGPAALNPPKNQRNRQPASSSEPEPRRELRLERVEDIPGRAEPERVRGRRVRIIDAAPYGVDVFHVGPVEHVEEIEQQLQPRLRIHGEFATDAQVDRRIAW